MGIRRALIVALAIAGCSTSSSSPERGNGVASPSSPIVDAGGAPDADAGPDPFGPRAVRPSGAPVETAAPNASSQTPAFPGQTRAPGDPSNVPFDVRVVTSGLSTPWAVAILPDGSQLVTERPGRMRIVTNGKLSAALTGVPAVAAIGQGGMLDVVLDPKFAENALVYFTFSEPRPGGQVTAVGRARLVQSELRLADVQVIWRMPIEISSSVHFGSRIVFARDGNLFVTLGERGVGGGANNAQNLASPFGKVIRIRPDGSVPSDNPFVGRAGAIDAIWSSGHRNPESAALHPRTGELWTVEHGARGGDEVNIVRKGKDYGWPTVTYGIDYSGSPIGAGITSAPGVEQPVYYWDPVIAPSGAAFYDADAFPAWRGSFFVGSLGGTHLDRLTIESDRVIGEERLLVSRGSRIRDVRVGPAGTLFVCDETKGELLEIVPKP
jgi:aldose sugar dehydrogenase